MYVFIISIHFHSSLNNTIFGQIPIEQVCKKQLHECLLQEHNNYLFGPKNLELTCIAHIGLLVNFTLRG